MTFADFENIVTLFGTIVGLLFCLFKYIERPKRVYLYLIVFFLAHFFSDYYWTVYTLVIHSNPQVSEFVAYFGWNIGYVFLFLAVSHMRREEARGYFRPVILWPVLANCAQLLLYIQYGGILNNLWSVGWSTFTMVLCMQDLSCYRNGKKQKPGEAFPFPYLSALVLVFLSAEYIMWTASCFYWCGELSNPYFYGTVLNALSSVFFAWGAGKVCKADEPTEAEKSDMELRFQTLLQVIVCFAIFFGCSGGYILAVRIKSSLPGADAGGEASGIIVTMLFVISFLLILMVLLLLHEIASHYRNAKKSLEEMDRDKLGRYNLIFTIVVTMSLMIFAVVFNSRALYQASVTGVLEDGRDVAAMTAVDLENYLTVAETTLRVAADTIDMMEQSGVPGQAIHHYLLEQTKRASEQFDENFTGIYAYVNGEFLDGSGWKAPAGYDPTSRDWYKAAVAGNGTVVIVPPYVDAQTGRIVVTFAQSISTSDHASRHNVVCIDMLVDHIQEVAEQVNIAGKGYGMVIDTDGFLIAHRDTEYNGKTVSEVYGDALLDRITEAAGRSFDTVMGGERCTLFVRPILEHWYAVVVVNNTELFEKVYTQLAFNLMVSLVAFWLISFFYYLGYKNERTYGGKVEEMNVEVVSALAAAIDAKDAYTNGHSARVAKYSKMIAARSGYSKSRQDEIYMMGLLHDVGKIGVPDEVIKKASELTDEEFEIVKRHPVIGSGILESIKERPNLATGARWHHELYAGGGYPDGFAGDEIPEEARIIAVADTYDAMTSRRSYRDVMPQAQVRAEIEKGSGTQFDPKFARIMIQMIDEDTNYSMREK